MEPQPKLFEYGIQIERSDIRIHVSPATRRLYVFKTAEAQMLLTIRGADYPSVFAFQPGVRHATAEGKLVPVEDIPDLRTVDLSNESWWVKFKPLDSTVTKGRKAVAVTLWALRKARIPLWINSVQESSNVDLQRKGADILLWARLRIQVKCDWTAGPVECGGSGNIFLQQAEINPLRRH